MLFEFAIELEIDGRQRVSQLVEAAGAKDRRGYHRICEYPGDRKLCQRLAAQVRDVTKFLDRFELALVPVPVLIHIAEFADLDREPSLVWHLVVPVFAGQQAASERIERNDGQLFFLGKRQQLTLNLAEQQVVTRLYRDEAPDTQYVRTADSSGETIGKNIRNAYIAGFPSADDNIESFQRFVDGRSGIIEVELVEIYIVGAKAAQRGIDCVEQMLA